MWNQRGGLKRSKDFQRENETNSITKAHVSEHFEGDKGQKPFKMSGLNILLLGTIKRNLKLKRIGGSHIHRANQSLVWLLVKKRER